MDFKLGMKISRGKKFNLLFFGLSLLMMIPIYSRGDESDFKVDEANRFPVVEKKSRFNKYEGKPSQKPSLLSELVFPGQKLFIERTGEWGGRLVYDGKPLIYKEKIEFNQLVFSPNHKVAIAFGSSYKPCNC